MLDVSSLSFRQLNTSVNSSLYCEKKEQPTFLTSAPSHNTLHARLDSSSRMNHRVKQVSRMSHTSITHEWIRWFFSCDIRFGSLLTDKRARSHEPCKNSIATDNARCSLCFRACTGQRMVDLIRTISRRASITLLRDSFNSCRDKWMMYE